MEAKNVKPYQTVLDEDASIYSTDEPKSEKQKWSEMNRQERVDYFISYYGLKTAYILAIIIVIAVVIYHFATNKEIALNVFAVNTTGTSAPADEVEFFEDFLEGQNFDFKENQITVNSNLGAQIDSDDSASKSNIQTIQTRFMTQSVDVFFADEAFYTAMGEMEYVSDLRLYLPEDLIEEYAEDLVYATGIDTGENVPVGIRLMDNEWMETAGWYEDGAVVGLAADVAHQELATALLEYILGYEE